MQTKYLILLCFITASEKLKINGHSLVLETDGTVIDEDDVLLCLDKETILLLQPNEIWYPVGADASQIATKTESFNAVTSEAPITPVEYAEDVEMLVVPSPSAISVTTNYELVWSDFIIPWHVVHPDLIESFEKGEKDSRHTTEVVRIIVQSMRSISTNIPANAFEIVGRKLVDQYPKIFQDVDDSGAVLGKGTHTITKKLIDRNNYLNRPKSSSSEGTPKNKKCRHSTKPRCLNFEPVEERSSQSSTTDQQKLNLYLTDKLIDDEFFILLESSFETIRQFLGDYEKLSNVLIHWPILFKSEAIMWHFHKLTNIDLNLLGNTLVEKSSLILAIVNSKNMIEPSKSKNLPDFAQAIEALCNYFKENFSYFIKNKDEEVTKNFIFIINYIIKRNFIVLIICIWVFIHCKHQLTDYKCDLLNF